MANEHTSSTVKQSTTKVINIRIEVVDSWYGEVLTFCKYLRMFMIAKVTSMEVTEDPVASNVSRTVDREVFEHVQQQKKVCDTLISKIQNIVSFYFGKGERWSDFDVLDQGVSLIAQHATRLLPELKVAEPMLVQLATVVVKPQVKDHVPFGLMERVTDWLLTSEAQEVIRETEQDKTFS